MATILEDAKRLQQIYESLNLTPENQHFVGAAVLYLRPVLSTLRTVLMTSEKLSETDADAVIIAALSTHTMGYSIHREKVLEGVTKEDYINQVIEELKDGKII